MLNTVTWSQYWLSILFASLVYYFYVWMRFYRPVLHGRNREMPMTAEAEQAMALPAGQEIYAYLAQSGFQQSSQPEIIYGLQQILRRHAVTIQPGDRPILTHWIQILCKDKLVVPLSEEEIKKVWLV